jgi:hypothetical protein
LQPIGEAEVDAQGAMPARFQRSCQPGEEWRDRALEKQKALAASRQLTTGHCLLFRIP